MGRQWASYASLVIGFAFIGVMWINHHRLFTHIQHCDNGLLLFNLLLLLRVTFVLFPTSVLAAHLGQADQKLAAMLYHVSLQPSCSKPLRTSRTFLQIPSEALWNGRADFVVN